MRTYLSLYFVFNSILNIAIAQHIALKNYLEQLKNDPDLKYAGISFYATYPKEKKTIAELNPYLNLSPASTLKVITTATAWSVLGGDYQFETKIEYDGEIKNNILEGNIYIVGTGDPSLGSDRISGNLTAEKLIEKAANAIKDIGIQKVNGAIVTDETYFEDDIIPRNWIWEDIGNYYGSPAYGLNIIENTYTLTFKTEKQGQKAELLDCKPKIPNLEFVNEMKVGSPNSGDQGFIFGAPYTYVRYLQGTLPENKGIYEIKGSIPDPPLFAAQMLHQYLVTTGISITQKPTTSRTTPIKSNNRTLIYRHLSPKLKYLILHTHLKSINLYAEALLKTIGKKKLGVGSTEAGCKAITQHWQSKGIDMKGVFINDGSGLSRSSAICAKKFVEILQVIYAEPWFKDFYESMSISGKQGYEMNMGPGTFLDGNVHLKGGYILRVCTYVGFMNDKNGNLICFAMLCNNYTCSITQMRKKWVDTMLHLAQP
ncbi:MAG: D-alanyl-D-alanine carboxypeptidase/D-alanyl-D-alanine-endopeptidase [Bacteroidia bacterium]|nr:D-alanyl-D-alanine carboxypeptidase/D-alanyl-D-alanine-endopeptidase [Bacteroidia bacterium]MDW8348439.1 D-alanyl-D-alanine carboxypeptidase/D-alanyl-D-alanine-endopeptidase [Bacteroidia bacterium]